MKTKSKICILPLILIGISLVFINGCQKEEESSEIKDKDGNVYTSVTIGTQVWMVENLKTTKFNDGTSIPLVTDNTAWRSLSTPGYCWYNNDAANFGKIYGALYNWYAVATGKLCPSGWHVPSNDEWSTLYNQFGTYVSAGFSLKEAGTAHWESPNTDATNVSGFTALPGGLRSSDFGYVGTHGFWWSSTENSTNQAAMHTIHYSYGTIFYEWSGKHRGGSVRCIKD